MYTSPFQHCLQSYSKSRKGGTGVRTDTQIFHRSDGTELTVHLKSPHTCGRLILDKGYADSSMEEGAVFQQTMLRQQGSNSHRINPDPN